MTLLVFEWQKLARLPALWGVLALCLAFNGLLLFDGDSFREPFSEAGGITAELGQRVDAAFLERFERRSRTEYEEVLLSSAREMTNIYQDYDLGSLSAFYQNVVKDSAAAQRLVEWKYRRLAPRVEHLAETGAAMDFYAGPATHPAHQFLYNTLFRAVLTEAAILGMLSMLYLLGYEDLRRTGQTVYCTRTGRKLCRKKVLAGLAAAVVLYALLAGAALLAYVSLWDCGGVWSASVSSQFNYLTNMLVKRPFLTWADFTVSEYLAAMLALGAALTAAFALLAAVCGLWIRNTYAAALVLAVLCLGGAGLAAALGEAGLWLAYFLSLVHPSCVWLSVNGWFTELGISGAVPWQETFSTGLDLLVLGLGALLGLRHFGRKDIVV